MLICVSLINYVEVEQDVLKITEEIEESGPDNQSKLDKQIGTSSNSYNPIVTSLKAELYFCIEAMA